MKKISYIIALATAAVLTSCSLDERVISSSLPENYYNTPQQVLTGLNGCYNNLRSIYGNANYFSTTEECTDLIYQTQRSRYEANCHVTPALPRFGSTLWTQGYQGVMRANAVLAALQRNNTMKDTEKAPLYAEGIILRAFFYYILTANFNGVPFYEDEVLDSNNAEISRLPRTDASIIRDKMVNEVMEVLKVERYIAEYVDQTDNPITVFPLDMLPTNDDENTRQYRVGACVGLMLAGKMALWNERWADAADCYRCIEHIYGDLSQYPLSDVTFSKRLVPESILELSNIRLDYGLQVTGGVASKCMPLRTELSIDGEETDEDEESDNFDPENNKDYYQGVKIPELGGNARTSSPNRPTKRLYQTLLKSNDKRYGEYDADGNEIFGGVGSLATGWIGWTTDEDPEKDLRHWCFFNNGTATSRPYLGPKFWCWGMQNTYDSNSYKIFRYAGALLGLSEAYFMMNKKEEACEAINNVRRRAGISELTTDNITMDEIQNEYGRELFGEFQRKHDLVRWGIWWKLCGPSDQYYDGVNKCKNYHEGGSLFKTYARPCHEYYPIPATEISYNPNLSNPEYSKYKL